MSYIKGYTQLYYPREPLLPLNIQYRPDLMYMASDKDVSHLDKVNRVKQIVEYGYKIDGFKKTRKQEYVAFRAAFISFFANTFRVRGNAFEGVTLLELAHAAGYINHTTALYHITKHESNYNSKTYFGTYYKYYYDFFKKIYGDVFLAATSVIEKRFLLGVES
jgi:hypothetical protein